MNMSLILSYTLAGAKSHLRWACDHAEEKGFDFDSMELLKKAIDDVEDVYKMMEENDKSKHPNLYPKEKEE